MSSPKPAPTPIPPSAQAVDEWFKQQTAHVRIVTPMDAIQWGVELIRNWTPEHTTGFLFGAAGVLFGFCLFWGP